MTRLEIFMALQDFGLTGKGAKELVNTGKHEAPFGYLTLEGATLKIKRKVSGEVVIYDLKEVNTTDN